MRVVYNINDVSFDYDSLNPETRKFFEFHGFDISRGIISGLAEDFEALSWLRTDENPEIATLSQLARISFETGNYELVGI